jgi:homoserine O-acetyltransferase
MVIDNEYYSELFHGEYELFNMAEFALEAGITLRGAQLAYVTCGELNRAKDNGVLVTTWFSGNHSVMKQLFIGPEHALDPEKYFIVIANQLGSGLGTSPHNTPAPHGRGRFPQLNIGDDVVAQERMLREMFGIEKLQLVTGASMGAQQTYEWAVRFPEKVMRAAPIAGTARTTPHCDIWVRTLIDNLVGDPAYAAGWYSESVDLRAALQRQAGLFALMGLSSNFWNTDFWRKMGFASAEDFKIGFLEGYFAPMDAGDLVCQAEKWTRGDVSRRTSGDLAAALRRITARTFVMPVSSDQFFPVSDCEADQRHIPNSELRVLDSDCGHLGLFHLEPSFAELVDRNLAELLEAST